MWFLPLQSINATVHTVSVASFSFTPANVTVNAGDTVRWVLASGIHTSTSSTGSTKTWDSGILGGGGFQLQFVAADGPGPFPYECSVHPFSMTGTVSVIIPTPTLFPFILDESEELLCAGTGSIARGY
jgi:plastocyanin